MRDVLVPVVAVAVVGAGLAVLAATHPLLARMAVRNALRRRSRILIVTFGLLIGTMIISSSLTVGDTLEYIFTGDVYDRLDAVDVTVTRDVGGQLFDFPEAYFHDLRNESVARSLAFDGMAPALQKIMPVRNNLTGNQAITVMGLDDAYEAGFGPLVGRDGSADAIAALPPDGVYVNEAAARDLNASAGNTLILFWGNNAGEVKYVQVRDVVRGEGKGAYGHLSIVFASLPATQSWFNATGKIDVVRVSAPGDVIGGGRTSGAVATAPAPIVSVQGWDVAVRDVKGDGLAGAQRIAGAGPQLLLVIGGIRVVAGV